MVKWLVIGGIGIVGLILIVVVAGMLMPKEHHATSTIELHQPPDSVWLVVRNFGANAEWWSDLQRVGRIEHPDGRERWNQQTKMGPVPLVVVADEPPRRLVTEIDVASDATFGGTWTYEIEPTSDGTRVRITEDGFINNVVFRFMANTVFSMHATMDSYLRALGRRFGEDVAPVHES